MIFLKKYKLSIILLIIFVISLILQNFFYNFINGMGAATCSTSPYNDFEAEYCGEAWNNGGKLWMGTKNLVVSPGYLLVPLFEQFNLIDLYVFEKNDIFIQREIYTYSYTDKYIWIILVNIINFIYWFFLFFLLNLFWFKKLAGKIVVSIFFLLFFYDLYSFLLFFLFGLILYRT